MKKPKKSIHVALEESMMASLVEYADKHKSTLVDVIRDSLTKVLPSKDTEIEVKLRQAINNFFILPESFTPRNFFAMLYMLASRYPNYNSKEFWGGGVYISGDSLNHREVFEAIKYRLTL